MGRIAPTTVTHALTQSTNADPRQALSLEGLHEILDYFHRILQALALSLVVFRRNQLGQYAVADAYGGTQHLHRGR